MLIHGTVFKVVSSGFSWGVRCVEFETAILENICCIHKFWYGDLYVDGIIPFSIIFWLV